MTLEQQLRDGLHGTPSPPTLVPPVGLADSVLTELGRRRRRNRTLAGVAAAVVAVAIAGGPLGLWEGNDSKSGSGPTASSDRLRPVLPPELQAQALLPRPGGGPRVIHAYSSSDSATTTLLLDPTTGRYHRVPYTVLLSPDLQNAVVGTGDRVGLVDRAKLLREGKSAIKWLDFPLGNGLAWSPDGTALVITSIEKTGGTPAFTAHRYTLATGTVTDTPIKLDLLGSAVGWAADSERYLALLNGAQTRDTVEPGALRYIAPDGTLGKRVEVEGGLIGGAESYSPSRKYVIGYAAGVMSVSRLPSPVIDLERGTLVGSLRADAHPIGWYDDRSAVLLDPGPGNRSVLEVVDVTTNKIVKRVELPRASGLVTLQIGSSAGLSGAAARLGF